MTQDTSESLAEDLSIFFVALMVFGFNPVIVILYGMMWILPMFVSFTVLEQPIVKDMMCIGMVQYLEFWMLNVYLWSEHTDQKRPITPRVVGALLLDTIPFYGLAYYALLHPMNMILKIILIIYGTIGGLPTMAILAELLNAPWLLLGGLLKDLLKDP